jgi:peptide deformylase
MAVRPIRLFGDPVLAAANAPVEDFGPALLELIRDLLETAWRAPGLGLAAPQVGVNLDLAVVDLSLGGDPGAAVVLANPEVVAMEGRVAVEEGCLSFPDLFVTIRRPRRLEVRAQDASGRSRVIAAEGLLAQALCHEVDHLDGVLLVDHLGGLRRQLFLRRVSRMRRRGRWEATARERGAPSNLLGLR